MGCPAVELDYDAERWPIERPSLIAVDRVTRGIGPMTLLSKASGVPYPSLNYARNKRTCKPGVARRLELATGIHRLKWMQPDEFGDAWREWEEDRYPMRTNEAVEALLGEIKKRSKNRLATLTEERQKRENPDH